MEPTPDIETLQAQCNEAVEHIEKIFAALIEQLKVWLDILIENFVKPFTRMLFSVRLVDRGFPAWLADFLSRKCPWRWIPVEWIYEPWTGRTDL